MSNFMLEVYSWAKRHMYQPLHDYPMRATLIVSKWKRIVPLTRITW